MIVDKIRENRLQKEVSFNTVVLVSLLILINIVNSLVRK